MKNEYNGNNTIIKFSRFFLEKTSQIIQMIFQLPRSFRAVYRNLELTDRVTLLTDYQR